MTADVFLALLLTHLLGDFVLQTDHQAKGKTTSWWCMAGHVVSYHALMLPVLWFATALPLGHILAVMAVSAGTHALIDRRWPVRWLLEHTGSRTFAQQFWGIIVVDQVLHISILIVLALVIA